MAELSAVTNSFASAPPSFSQKDRSEELRDARQPVSQFDNRQLAQNETAVKDQRANSATTVFAATGVSDSNTGRQTATAAGSLETSSASTQASLQQTADAFEQQLQRAALERRARPQENPPATAGTANEVQQGRQNETRTERTEALANNEPAEVDLQSPGNAPAADRADPSADRNTASADEVAAERQSTLTEQRQNAPEAATETPARENAEDALGFGTA